nr:polysaccharide lyase beta-sandwich domain-containing protein [Pedobacter jejuensis]
MIIENDKKAQVIAGKTDAILMMVVYQPTIIKAKSFPTLSFENPGIYILERKEDHWLASIADPTQKLTNVNWKIAGKTQVTLMPSSVNRGQTIQVKIPFY